MLLAAANGSTDTIGGMSTTEVTAWATIALAAVGALAFIASVVLAIITRGVANATKQAAQATQRSAEATETAAKATETAAKATQDEAAATRDEAEASKAVVDEMRHDRELAYRPYISWRLTEATTNAPGGPVIDLPTSPRVVGANFGRGPALYCLCVAFWPEQMVKARSTLLFDLSPNETLTKDVVRAQPRGWGNVPGPDVVGPIPTGAQFFRVAFCLDQLGNAYRFLPFGETDVWRPNESRPAWLEWYELRRKDLAKI
jgi:hypothetical protein